MNYEYGVRRTDTGEVIRTYPLECDAIELVGEWIYDGGKDVLEVVKRRIADWEKAYSFDPDLVDALADVWNMTHYGVERKIVLAEAIGIRIDFMPPRVCAPHQSKEDSHTGYCFRYLNGDATGECAWE